MATTDTSVVSQWFRSSVLDWAQLQGRHDFPWQAPHTPYKTWISEIMLQQTQAERVVTFFNRFIEELPSVYDLAQAQEDLVFHLWSGLGYYTRAQNLLRAARLIVDQHQGQVPTEIATLLTLPGIGRSTAGAIRSLGHGLDGPILDGNVRRVFGRFAMIDGKPQSKAMENQYWALANQLTPGQNVLDRAFNQGMMDLGATVCKIKTPLCQACPLQSKCAAFNAQQIQNFPVTPSKYRQHMQLSKAKRRQEQRFYLILQSGHFLLLVKRPPTGIWRNLWCPPEYHSYDELKANVSALSSTKAPIQTRPLKPIFHQFSHFDLNLAPYLGDCTEDQLAIKISEPNKYLWYDLTDPPSLGLASPVIKLFEQIRAINIKEPEL